MWWGCDYGADSIHNAIKAPRGTCSEEPLFSSLWHIRIENTGDVAVRREYLYDVVDMNTVKIKLDFISGLRDVVLTELARFPEFHVLSGSEGGKERIYVEFTEAFARVRELRSVLHAYLIKHDKRYTPRYIANHKSVLGELITTVVADTKQDFSTFKISCAGSDSPEVRALADYVEHTFGLIEKAEADLKIHIITFGGMWEVGVQITLRPISLREYRAAHMSGSMDPTIAYAMNSLCSLGRANSYLNIFSGSATLLVEAGQCYSNLERLVGFDNDKKRLSLAVQNIKKAGLIKRVNIKGQNIFDKPNLGTFDVITSDLPFGMAISKGENLKGLYQCFIDYCEDALNQHGVLAIYTNEHKLLSEIMARSRFAITKTLRLEFMTNGNAYLHPKLFICTFAPGTTSGRP